MKNLNKKIGVVALSGLALVGGSLVGGKSIAHGMSIEEYARQLEQHKEKEAQGIAKKVADEIQAKCRKFGVSVASWFYVSGGNGKDLVESALNEGDIKDFGGIYYSVEDVVDSLENGAKLDSGLYEVKFESEEGDFSIIIRAK